MNGVLWVVEAGINKVLWSYEGIFETREEAREFIALQKTKELGWDFRIVKYVRAK